MPEQHYTPDQPQHPSVWDKPDFLATFAINHPRLLALGEQSPYGVLPEHLKAANFFLHTVRQRMEQGHEVSEAIRALVPQVEVLFKTALEARYKKEKGTLPTPEINQLCWDGLWRQCVMAHPDTYWDRFAFFASHFPLTEENADEMRRQHKNFQEALASHAPQDATDTPDSPETTPPQTPATA